VSLQGLKILFSPRAACDPTDTCYRIPPQKERGRDGAREKQDDLGENATCSHTQAFLPFSLYLSSDWENAVVNI